jgi:hypothetical protein
MQMAGIYEDSTFIHYKTQETVQMRTFAILTGEPSDTFNVIHDRQPIFLSDEQAIKWLDPDYPAPFDLLTELKNNVKNSNLYLNNKLKFYPVTKKITDIKYQAEDCTKEISLGQNLTTFFKKTIDSPMKVQNDSQISNQSASTIRNTTTVVNDIPHINHSSDETIRLSGQKRSSDFDQSQTDSISDVVDLTQDDDNNDVDDHGKQQQRRQQLDDVADNRTNESPSLIQKKKSNTIIAKSPLGKYFQQPSSSSLTIKHSIQQKSISNISPKKKAKVLTNDITNKKIITNFFTKIG